MPKIHIDKLYNIDSSDMDAEKWVIMGKIYEQLPGFLGYHDGCACWFGTEEAFGLYASMESPGLQIAGTVHSENWALWEKSFLNLVSERLGVELKVIADNSRDSQF